MRPFLHGGRRQKQVLAAFKPGDEISVQEIRKRFGLTLANAVQVLRRLVARGALERVDAYRLAREEDER